MELGPYSLASDSFRSVPDLMRCSRGCLSSGGVDKQDVWKASSEHGEVSGTQLSPPSLRSLTYFLKFPLLLLPS